MICCLCKLQKSRKKQSRYADFTAPVQYSLTASCMFMAKWQSHLISYIINGSLKRFHLLGDNQHNHEEQNCEPIPSILPVLQLKTFEVGNAFVHIQHVQAVHHLRHSCAVLWQVDREHTGPTSLGKGWSQSSWACWLFCEPGTRICEGLCHHHSTWPGLLQHASLLSLLVIW